MDSSDSETEQQKMFSKEKEQVDITDDESYVGVDYEEKGDVKEYLDDQPKDS